MVEMINRGPGVVGWDSTKEAPKGVVSPTAHRGGIAPIAQREGVFTSGKHTEAALTTSNSSREVTITPANVAITAPMGGWYLPWWTSLVRLTPAAAGSQARIDVVFVAQRDYELDGLETDSPALIDIKQGVASATPQRPSLSDGELGLWELKIPAGATTSSEFSLTKLFDWTAPFGSFPTAATETELRQMPATLGAIGLVTTTGARWMRRASGWVAETGPWTSTLSWTWGNGFHPADPWANLPTIMYRLVDFGRRVQLRGLVARDSGSGMVAMVNVPAELRPTSAYQPSIQAAQIAGQGGNITSAVGVTAAEWISLEWDVAS